MEYLLGVISLTSLALNYIIYRRIISTYPVASVDELEFTTSHCCCEAVIEHLEKETPVDIEVNIKPPEKKSPEAYSAWVNRTGIPMVPPTKPPEPIIKPPNRGPLARPDGFI